MSALRNLEAERALLAAALVAPHRVGELEDLGDRHFTQGEHRVIWTAMRGLAITRRDWDPPALRAQLDGMGHLTDEVRKLVMHLEAAAASAVNLPSYADMLRQAATRRAITAAAERAAKLAADPEIPVGQVVDGAEAAMASARSRRTTRAPVREAVFSAVRRIQNAQAGRIDLVQTGLSRLDHVLGGGLDAELVIAAARPGIGKSAIAMQWALAAAERGLGVLVFSLEMPKEQLGQRMLANLAQVEHRKIRNGELTPRELARVVDAGARLVNLPIEIEDEPDRTIGDIRASCRQAKRDMPKLGLVIVDYIGLAKGVPGKRYGTRAEEVGEVSRGLKNLAQELGVPVIALSQFNRELEKDKRKPRLDDLRDSGSIEQDAAIVLLLHRDPDARSADEEPYETHVELILAKQRNGPSRLLIDLAFQPAWLRFVEGKPVGVEAEPKAAASGANVRKLPGRGPRAAPEAEE